MKLLAVALLGAAMIAGSPVLAQGNDDRSDNTNAHRQDARAPVRSEQISQRPSRRVKYKRNYTSDQEEHQQTEDLNRQYRGVDRSDVH
jgi:Ni/Co efflux regulator RcnB